MDIWKAILIGIIQGLAEFLPISSSGHIVLAEHFLGVRGGQSSLSNDMTFEIVLHLGTLLSVFLFFRKSLWRLLTSLWTPQKHEERKQILFLGIATLPAVVAALLFGDFLKRVANAPIAVGGLLLLTGCILYVPVWVRKARGKLGWLEAFLMGVGQAFAILPGISRSGSTIAAGLVCGVEAKKAAEFSFLMSIPAILGGFVFNMKESIERYGSVQSALSHCFSFSYVCGALAAGLMGMLAIYWVMGAVKKGALQYFSYYCFAAGLFSLAYFTLWAS